MWLTAYVVLPNWQSDWKFGMWCFESRDNCIHMSMHNLQWLGSGWQKHDWSRETMRRIMPSSFFPWCHIAVCSLFSKNLPDWMVVKRNQSLMLQREPGYWLLESRCVVTRHILVLSGFCPHPLLASRHHWWHTIQITMEVSTSLCVCFFKRTIKKRSRPRMSVKSMC